MCFRKVLAIGSFALVEIGHRVAAEAIESEIQPEAGDIEHFLVELGIVVVQIGLVIEEAVPEILTGDWIERSSSMVRCR